MPIAIDHARCTCGPSCFAARMCPRHTLVFDETRGHVVVDPELCGDCSGICTNFCDAGVLKFNASLAEVRLIQAELDGTMTRDEVLAERERRRAEQAPPPPLIAHATAATFEAEVLSAPLPVIVDFWAEWCAPCRQMAPALETLAEQYADQVRVVKVNTDAEPGLAARYGVQALPTLIAFWDGQPVDQMVGALPLSSLQTWAYQVLSATRGAASEEASVGR